ncbi:MAG: hypothetical protein U0869_24445 [Chloroflexota bacterium]
MHDSLEIIAAGLVVALPFVVVGVSRWARGGPAGRSVPLPVWLVAAVALLSGAAAVIHLLVIEEHLAESKVTGLAFALLAAFQGLWAVWYAARPSAWLGWLAVVVNAGAIGVWVLSRTAGVPDWLSPEGVEGVGLPDVACAVLELGVIAGLLALHWRPMRARVAEGRAITRADAGLTMTMIGLAALLLTLGSIATIAAEGGHGHGDTEIEVAPHDHG